MPAYLYRARDKSGKLLEGKIEASSEREAADILRRGGVFITSLEEEKALKATLQREIKLGGGGKKVELQDLAIFARGISTMLEAGVPLLQALRGMADQTTNQYLAQVIGEVADKVARGYSFYQALADYPQVFNRVFVGMVQSGESGGNLDWSLQRLADYLEWEKDLRDKIQSATYYPLILIVAIIVVSLFMVYFVFPQFVTLFEGFQMELPSLTKFMLNVMDFLGRNWLPVYGSLGGAILAFILYIRSEQGKRWWDSLQPKLPLFGQLFHKLLVSRFCWLLSGLLRSGMPMVQALEVTASSVGNYYVGDIIQEIAEDIRRGSNLSQGIAEHPFFPPLVAQMIAVGEETGSLELTLGKVTELYDKEIKVFVDRISTIIEPVLTVIIGGAVLLLALALFLPIFQMASGGMSAGF